MKQILIASVIVLLLILSCGCTVAPPAQSPPATSTTVATPPQVTHTSLPAPVSTERTSSVSDNTITIIRNTFSPTNMTVNVGSTVRWVNADDHPHRIAFTKEGFLETPYLLGASQSASQRFDSAGTFDYFCTIHPYMRGTITAVGA